jgi:hypothetical protein
MDVVKGALVAFYDNTTYDFTTIPEIDYDQMAMG